MEKVKLQKDKLTLNYSNLPDDEGNRKRAIEYYYGDGRTGTRYNTYIDKYRLDSNIPGALYETFNDGFTL